MPRLCRCLILQPQTGVIALCNLHAQIEGHQRRRSPDLVERTMFIDLISLRGHICGCVSDAEAAAAQAEELAHDIASGTAFFVRAKSRGAFHLFSDASDDLDLAERHGMDMNTVRNERATILEAIGRYDEALALRREAVTRACTFEFIGALASIHAARRECDDAERLFEDSRRRYRGSHPVRRYSPAEGEANRHAKHQRLGNLGRGSSEQHDRQRINVRFGPLCGLKSDTARGLGSARRRHPPKSSAGAA